MADTAALAAAYDDMAAGCRFLIARGLDASGRNVPPGIAMRRAANCLKELDRFLVVMIDACVAPDSAPHGNRAVYVREGDAAARLCRIRMLHGAFARDIARLRAIGRIRGLALGDAPAEVASRPMRDLALATMGHDLADQAPGAPFALGDRALGAIAAYYLSLADRLRGVIAAA